MGYSERSSKSVSQISTEANPPSISEDAVEIPKTTPTLKEYLDANPGTRLLRLNLELSDLTSRQYTVKALEATGCEYTDYLSDNGSTPITEFVITGDCIMPVEDTIMHDFNVNAQIFQYLSEEYLEIYNKLKSHNEELTELHEYFEQRKQTPREAIKELCASLKVREFSLTAKQNIALAKFVEYYEQHKELMQELKTSYESPLSEVLSAFLESPIPCAHTFTYNLDMILVNSRNKEALDGVKDGSKQHNGNLMKQFNTTFKGIGGTSKESTPNSSVAAWRNGISSPAKNNGSMEADEKIQDTNQHCKK